MTHNSIKLNNNYVPVSLFPPETPAKDYPGHNPAYYRGKRWNLVTFGIPLLINKISLFFQRLIKREKAGNTIGIQFNAQNISNENKTILNRFKSFYVPANRPLKINQRDMLIEIYKKTKVKQEQALIAKDTKEVCRCEQKRKDLRALLKKHMTKNVTKRDFTESDWKLVDEIDYELVKRHCAALSHLFNSNWFSNSVQTEKLKKNFKIDYHESLVAEIIAFNIAYIQDLDGKSIDLPIYDPNLKQFRNATYTVTYTTIGDNLPCYLLESKDELASPWFTIRGTQRFIKKTTSGQEMRIGSSESMLADVLDKECIAGNLINRAIVKRPVIKVAQPVGSAKYEQKESLEDIFRRIKISGKKVLITGHSLGGTIAITLGGTEYADYTKTVYGFSSAGVSKKTLDHWTKFKKDTPQGKQPHIINFAPEGDPIPSGGSCLIGDHFALSPLDPRHPKGLSRSHNRRHFWNDFKIQAVDVDRENRKIERKVAEKLRILIGKLIGFSLKLSRKKKGPDWWRNKVLYQKQADIVRKMRPLILAAETAS